jgi:non-specific serine/threonine protein kinase
MQLYGENVFQVAPLAFPDEAQWRGTAESTAGSILEKVKEYPSVALFCQRATAAEPEFELTLGNARAVAEVCARLQGLPLAIELAAARITQFSPLQMRERLAKRLDLLATGERNRPARHQTMRGALEWSYGLLNEREKQLFRRLGILAGSWDILLAGFVVGADGVVPMTVDVNSLVNKSLVQRVGGGGEETRYTMFETVREFALEKLAEHAETEQLEREHALYYLEMVREAEAYLLGPSQAQWLNRIESDLDGIRAALEWAVRKGEAEFGMEITNRLGRFWTVHDHWAEGRRWLDRLLEMPEASEPTRWRAQGLWSAGVLADWMSDFDAVEVYLDEASALARQLEEERLYGQILTILSGIYLVQGKVAMAEEAGERGMELFARVGNESDVAWGHLTRGSLLLQQAKFEQAAAEYDFCLNEHLRLGDHWSAGAAYTMRGLAARIMGDAEMANRCRAEALSLFSQVNDQARIGLVHFFLGSGGDAPEKRDAELAFFREQLQVQTRAGHKPRIADAMLGVASALHRRGEYAEAEAMYCASLRLNRELRKEISVAECIAGLAGVAAFLESPERAARLFGAADGLVGFRGGPLARALGSYRSDLATAETLLDAESFQRYWGEGAAMSREEAVGYALGDWVIG